jgi:hypothetical protein
LITRAVREPHALEGAPRLVAAALHRSIVAQELLLERALDALATRPVVDESLF